MDCLGLAKTPARGTLCRSRGEFQKSKFQISNSNLEFPDSPQRISTRFIRISKFPLEELDIDLVVQVPHVRGAEAPSGPLAAALEELGVGLIVEIP